MSVPTWHYLPLSSEQDNTSAFKTKAATWVPTLVGWWMALENQVVDFAGRHAGLLLMLLESLNPSTPTLELIAIRMVITVCGCMAFILTNKIPDPFFGPKGVRGHLAAGGLSVFFGLFGMFYSLNYISVADATVITFLKPFTVALAGHFFLGENFTKNEAAAAICSLVGVILIARPSFLFGDTGGWDDDGAFATSFERLRAVGSSIMGVCGGTASFIIMRFVRSQTHPMHVMTFYSFWCGVVASTTIAVMRESMVFPMTWQWIVLLLVITLLGVAAQILVTIGLRFETATRGALVTYTQLLFAVVLELVVFGSIPSLLSAVGGAIIIASQTYAILSKQKPAEHPQTIGMRDSSSEADGIEACLLRSESAGASSEQTAAQEQV